MASLSGTSFEGPARRVYSAVRASIPEMLLSPAAIKERGYDRMTLQIARIALASGGSAIDVGAHEGDILRVLTRMSRGRHWAFEPIPAFADRLRRRFPAVTIEQVALADYEGDAEFRFMPGAAAYSSLLTRPEIEEGHRVRQLGVRVRRLDDCIPPDARVVFLKIDVEGSEAAVLRGSTQLLSRCQPTVVFECASARLPECMAALKRTELLVSFLADYLAGVERPAGEVADVGRKRGEYYYAAHPARLGEALGRAVQA